MTIEELYVVEKYKLNPGLKTFSRLLKSMLGIEKAGNPDFRNELEHWQADDCDDDTCGIHNPGAIRE